ncbi:MAG: hypothetical protein LBN95_01590 [Prevotellaceae bacterium]|jgi:hypothetical protein|nr:hypothetical protein [Prevotellaceae bacterium]
MKIEHLIIGKNYTFTWSCSKSKGSRTVILADIDKKTNLYLFTDIDGSNRMWLVERTIIACIN